MPASQKDKMWSRLVFMGLFFLWSSLPSAASYYRGEKDGVCPIKSPEPYFCSRNGDCIFGPCCRRGVQGRCLPPRFKDDGVCRTEGKYCRDYCSDDFDCMEKKKCCTYGCRKACLDPMPEKAGFCPILWTTYTYCRDECRDDSRCSGRQKCCQAGCRKECHEPLPEKQGTCPALIFQHCTSECFSDKDCQGQRKCCGVGCGSLCLTPSFEKEGICPTNDGQQQPSSDCVYHCSQDVNCAGKRKCCKTGCGTDCLEPLTGKGA
ncbi:whey acidic protein-like [Anolis sagrei]|uniref:whey acidic protein-like n=1 Tax=Anolis sagrei TaxID=38937 RepID=UPI003521C325